MISLLVILFTPSLFPACGLQKAQQSRPLTSLQRLTGAGKSRLQLEGEKRHKARVLLKVVDPTNQTSSSHRPISGTRSRIKSNPPLEVISRYHGWCVSVW